MHRMNAKLNEYYYKMSKLTFIGSNLWNAVFNLHQEQTPCGLNMLPLV